MSDYIKNKDFLKHKIYLYDELININSHMQYELEMFEYSFVSFVEIRLQNDVSSNNYLLHLEHFLFKYRLWYEFLCPNILRKDDIVAYNFILLEDRVDYFNNLINIPNDELIKKINKWLAHLTQSRDLRNPLFDFKEMFNTILDNLIHFSRYCDGNDENLTLLNDIKNRGNNSFVNYDT